MKNKSSVILTIVMLFFWQLLAMILNAAYILPTPIQVLSKLWELKDVLIFVHLPATFAVTAIGLIISIIFGALLAVLMDMNEAIEKAVYPVVIASQTIPITAIAPLFILWFGYSIWSKVLVSVLITFFPITITLYDGFRSVRRESLELMETYGASKSQIFFKLKFPYVMPYFFSALKMALPLSVIGAAIGEWLGAQSGLGYFSKRMMTQLDGAGVFAPIVLLSLAAMASVKLITILEERLIHWRREI